MIKSRKLAVGIFIGLLLILLAFAIIFTGTINIGQPAFADEEAEAMQEPDGEAETVTPIDIRLYIVLSIVAVMLVVVIIVAAAANRKYTLSFIVGKNGSPVPERKYHAGEAIDPLPTPIRPNAQFGGWYKDPYLSEPFNFSNMSKQDVRAYAKWKRKSIRYYRNNKISGR